MIKNDKIPGELKWCRLYHCYSCGEIIILARNKYPDFVCCNAPMEFIDLQLRYDNCQVSDWMQVLPHEPLQPEIAICTNSTRTILELDDTVFIYIPLTSIEAFVLKESCVNPSLRIKVLKHD